MVQAPILLFRKTQNILYFSAYIWYNNLGIDILPQNVSKALYLDGDVIVEQDLKELWNIMPLLTNPSEYCDNLNPNLDSRMKNANKKLKEYLQMYNNYSSNNSNEIIQLYKKIDNLNEIIKRYPIILEENEKLISVIFASSDQTMHYSMICKNTDNLSDLEKKLYKEFPNFIESDNIFLCKGTVINKYKTFESYNIKNGDILVLNKRDD